MKRGVFIRAMGSAWPTAPRVESFTFNVATSPKNIFVVVVEVDHVFPNSTNLPDKGNRPYNTCNPPMPDKHAKVASRNRESAHLHHEVTTKTVTSNSDTTKAERIVNTNVFRGGWIPSFGLGFLLVYLATAAEIETALQQGVLFDDGMRIIPCRAMSSDVDIARIRLTSPSNAYPCPCESLKMSLRSFGRVLDCGIYRETRSQMFMGEGFAVLDRTPTADDSTSCHQPGHHVRLCPDNPQNIDHVMLVGKMDIMLPSVQHVPILFIEFTTKKKEKTRAQPPVTNATTHDALPVTPEKDTTPTPSDKDLPTESVDWDDLAEQDAADSEGEEPSNADGMDTDEPNQELEEATDQF
ncbi:hypothetical protein O0I10_009116 [Lichtheimia ornata]|uniref:Uncharacterized protein n=1 Tax=Lichtheimia ornata TaxID=688661 RepID=A0AAD7UX29_9FUNG|nr:uncharacterized protein O0I10_009116 [Lichtheimia ornata]KAJ8655248.1 hypothetical protein O0I10_009116 [Lichtheimia ornata]